MQTVSIENAARIGDGARTSAFRLGATEVVRVFAKGQRREEIERQVAVSKAAFAAGVPTPEVFELVEVHGKNLDERLGVLCAFGGDKTLGDMVATDPNHIEDYARVGVNLLERVHACQADPTVFPPAMTMFKQQFLPLASKLLSEDECAQLAAYLDSAPEPSTLLHGDFHPNNVLFKEGVPTLIDLDEMMSGHTAMTLGACISTWS